MGDGHGERRSLEGYKSTESLMHHAHCVGGQICWVARCSLPTIPCSVGVSLADLHTSGFLLFVNLPFEAGD